MSENDNAVSFLVALPYGANRLFLGASPDSDPPYASYSVWYVYIGDDDEPWTHYVNRWWAVSAAKYVPPTRQDEDDWALVGMSNEGELDFNFGADSAEEKISGAGVFCEDAEGWGYMSRLKQIGQHLYACGDGGQVYIRRGPSQWEHMDAGLLQAPDVSERLILSVFGGPHEQAIYLGGSISRDGHPACLFFWNGQKWQSIPLPEVAERLTDIYVESETRIWLCGANGTLLCGNSSSGFISLSDVDDNQLFYSITMFDGLVYLGSNIGLFVYNPDDQEAGINEVVTGLNPELQNANIVDSCDGFLWSIGEKDIARFDGSAWERINHPDNPKIGS